MVASVFPRWKGDATPAFVENLATALAGEGWEVTVLAPHAAGAAKEETVAGVRVRRFSYFFPKRYQKLCYEGGMLINLRTRPWTRLLLPLFFLAQLAALRREIRSFRPTLLHSHSLLPQGLSVAIMAKRFGLPHITTSHGNDVFGLRPDGLMGRMKRSVLRRANAITVNSRATREAVLALGAEAARVHWIPAMPNPAAVNEGMRLKLKQSWAGSGPVLFFAGRMIAEKGVSELIQAFGKIRREFPEARLILGGEGPDRPRFAREAAELRLSEAIEFVGWIESPEVPTWMAAADLVVVPSQPGQGGWKEAQGLVAVEGMGVGTPVVASAFGGLVDMIEDGVTGYLCQPGSIDSLADALGRAARCSEGDRARRVEAALQRHRERFSAEAVANDTLAIYAEVSEASPTPV
jgi:phosphatidyl-myo-inositol dimannoside synthase